MKEYNEYIRITRCRLKNYADFKAQIANLTDDIEALEMELQTDVNAPIAKYGLESGGGTSELNSVESAASRHDSMREKIAAKKQTIARLTLNLRKIDRAVDVLPPEDRFLIRRKYMEGFTWQQIAIETNQSEKWLAERGRKALDRVAGMLFADKITADQLKLDFAFF